eukprot:69895_1
MHTAATPLDLSRNATSLTLQLCDIPSVNSLNLMKSTSSSVKSSETMCFIPNDHSHTPAHAGVVCITNQDKQVLKIAHIHTRPSDQEFEVLPLPIPAKHNMDTPAARAQTHYQTDSQMMNIMGLLAFHDITAGNTPQSSNEIECLSKNGYCRKDKICNALQGEVFVAQTMNGTNVAIKKTYKNLHYQHMALKHMYSEGTHIIEEDIIKEAVILQYLTVDNKPSNGSIVKLIEFFESDDAFYLVTEHVGTLTLAQFNQKAHQLIAQKKLKTKTWKQIVKYLVWQLSVILYWLHNDMQCCHLDLCLQNIMVMNGEFKEDNEGNVDFDPNISVKLLDFGLGEVFGCADDFECCKYGERERHYLSAPRVFAEEMFDARKADVWSLGIILYELATGLEPYRAQDVMGGKKKVTQPNTLDNLMRLIALNGKSKCVNQSMIQLMAEMLHIEEEKRVNVDDILHNPWMSLYYKRYKAQIAKKSEFQSLKNKRRVKEMNGFPFYNA